MEDTQKLINEDSSSGTEITPSSSACTHSAVSIDSKSVKINDGSSKKNLKKIRSALFKCISEDPVGADAKWNLFIAACQSYRYDSCLKPFPPMFLKAENEKDINSLLNTIDGIPSFVLLEKFLSVSDNVFFNENMLQLLHWGLVQMHDPSLRSVPKEKFSEVLSLAPSELNAQKPDYIFKLKYSENTPSYTKWQNYKRSYKTLYAYHGSRLENFHSIIHYGLQLSFTKTPLFGQGVYLSSELLVSLPYSSTGFGWGKSVLGGELSVVALCEILDHPSTHCQTKGTKDKNRALASDSMAGEVPHKYYVVSNSELIRIQYLLVYARSLPAPVGVHPSSATQRESIFGWMKEHKLLTAIMGYVFLLASVGLSNNQHVLRYYKMFLNKAGLQ